MASIQDQLFTLQKDQLYHDELFHRDIAQLSAHHRINHMALHFTKYVGNICDVILNNKDQSLLRKNIIDAFVISVSSANILNIRVSDALLATIPVECDTFPELADELVKHLNIDTKDPLWLVKHYPVAVGRLAKACEAVDHLEPFRFRESISEQVIKIQALMIVAADQLNIDLSVEVPLRLEGVKKKSIFFDHITSTTDQLMMA